MTFGTCVGRCGWFWGRRPQPGHALVPDGTRTAILQFLGFVCFTCLAWGQPITNQRPVKGQERGHHARTNVGTAVLGPPCAAWRHLPLLGPWVLGQPSEWMPFTKLPPSPEVSKSRAPTPLSTL